jgi:hypothetical protein
MIETYTNADQGPGRAKLYFGGCRGRLSGLMRNSGLIVGVPCRILAELEILARVAVGAFSHGLFAWPPSRPARGEYWGLNKFGYLWIWVIWGGLGWSGVWVWPRAVWGGLGYKPQQHFHRHQNVHDRAVDGEVRQQYPFRFQIGHAIYDFSRDSCFVGLKQAVCPSKPHDVQDGNLSILCCKCASPSSAVCSTTKSAKTHATDTPRRQSNFPGVGASNYRIISSFALCPKPSGLERSK